MGNLDTDLYLMRCTVSVTTTHEVKMKATTKALKEKDFHIGSSFDEFLEEQGIRNEVHAAAIKRVLAWQFEQAMEKQAKTKQALARELKPSRSQLDRLLDPDNTAVSLETITRAANALGKEFVFEIRDRRSNAAKRMKRRAS